MNNQDITIYNKDELNIFDSLFKQKKDEHKLGPLGWARVFFDGQLHHDGPNMIMGQGRQFINKKIFNKDFSNYYISHFGIGDGGPKVVNGVVTSQNPVIDRTSLYNTIQLGDANSNYLNISGKNKALKPLGSGNITTVNVQHGSVNYATTMKCNCIISKNEPYNITTYQLINEAGLFYSLNGTSNPYLFSHITFAPKYKEPEGTITIEWYILC